MKPARVKKCMYMVKANVTRYSARENYPGNVIATSCISSSLWSLSSSSSSSSYVTSCVYQDLFRALLLVCSKVFQVVFVHLVYNSTLFLASCCCSFLLHVVANFICIFLVFPQLCALSWMVLFQIWDTENTVWFLWLSSCRQRWFSLFKIKAPSAIKEHKYYRVIQRIRSNNKPDFWTQKGQSGKPGVSEYLYHRTCNIVKWVT